MIAAPVVAIAVLSAIIPAKVWQRTVKKSKNHII